MGIVMKGGNGGSYPDIIIFYYVMNRKKYRNTPYSVPPLPPFMINSYERW